MKRNRAGFTLIEIMIVVCIVGILLAIALPNLAHARESSRRKACMNNLHKLEWAKDSYLLDANLPKNSPASTFTDAALYGQDRYLRIKPQCPGSGTYSINDGDTFPTCNYGDGTIHTYAQ